PTPPFAIRRF
ncbi:hypothetical protein D046_5798B, partial [Vibrio parahaemolyticus V-223/04]